MLALWNTPDPQPDHALRAVRAALSILERSQRAYDRLEDRSHYLQFRIGMTTGEAMVGNVGTSELFNYGSLPATITRPLGIRSTWPIGWRSQPSLARS